MSDKPKETLDQKIVRYHAKFLEAIKETYPLAVLGSLCITIAAFTTNTYPDVQTYALAAASLLLFSFGFSFIMKFLPSSYLAICSYVSAGLGAIFIYLVLSSFMKYIPIISRSLGLVTNVAVIFTELSFLYFVYVFGKRQRSFRMNRIIFFFTIPFGICVIVFLVVNTVFSFYNYNMPSIINDFVFPIILTAFFGSIIILFIYEIRSRKKQSSVSTKNTP